MEDMLLHNLSPIEIQEFQQNRYPCFFLDMVIEAEPGKYARGYKNFSFNEWFFPCHFADEPNVPGFIQIEMMTQMFLMTFLTIPENKGKKTCFISVNNAKFKLKIIPGMRVDLHAELKSYRRGIAIGSCVGYVNGEEACSVELMVGIPDVLNQFKPKQN